MPRKPTPPLERFWPKVDITTECWVWSGAVHRNGYGKFYLDGRVQTAHRAAYVLLVGPIPDGRDLDHLCRNRRCVNPEHLEPVTRRENVRRGESQAARLAQATHCKRGHEFSDGNTYRRPNGTRECRRCHADNAAQARKARA